jgi:copper transport protein
MNMTRLSVRPAVGWLLSLLAFALVGSLWAPTADAADNTVIASTPTADSTVETSPSLISITFAQPLGTEFSVVLACNSEAVNLGKTVLLADGVTLQAPLISVVPKAACTVSWRVTDLQLQPAGSSSFGFTISNDPAPATTTTSTVPPTPGETFLPVDTSPGATIAPVVPGGGSDVGSSSDSPGEPSGQGPLGLFRLFSTLGLAVLFGSLVLIAVAWPEGVEYILTLRFLKTTWFLALASTFLFAGALQANASGASLGSSLSPTAWGDLLDSTPGKAAVLRFVFTAICGYVVLRPERAIDPGTQLPALVPPGIAVVTLAFSRNDFGLLENAVGAVHVLAMAVWLGGLVLLTRVVLAGPGEEDLVHAVRGFTRLATPALWATVASGAIQFFQLDRGALGSSHGLVAIVKILFVALMVFVGVAARQFISQRVSRVDTMTVPLANRLRRALGIEAVVGVLVLALTAWLLSLTPPRLGAAEGSSLTLGSVHTFQTSDVRVDVAFSERVGTNDVRIEVVAPAAGVTGLTVEFQPPPGKAIGGLIINNIPLVGTGVAVLEKSDGFTLAATGNWTVVVSANGAEIGRQAILVSGAAATTTTTTG